MKGKSRAGILCRDMAAGASHGEELFETGPGGDRLNKASRPGRYSPLSEARMLVRDKVPRREPFGETGWYRGFSVPFEGRFFYV